MQKIKISSEVTRIAKDYTGGRKGTVVEINEQTQRARVLWHTTPNGAPMKLRTWVRFSDLQTQIL